MVRCFVRRRESRLVNASRPASNHELVGSLFEYQAKLADHCHTIILVPRKGMTVRYLKEKLITPLYLYLCCYYFPSPLKLLHVFLCGLLSMPCARACTRATAIMHDGPGLVELFAATPNCHFARFVQRNFK